MIATKFGGTSQKSTQSNFDGADTEEARASHASSHPDGAYGKYNVGASHTFKEARKANIDEKKERNERVSNQN